MGDVMAEFYDGPHATPPTAADGPVYLGIKNLTEDGHLELGEVRHISEDDFGTWTKRVEPRAGDLVFTYEASLHRYAIIPVGFRGTLGRRVALIRPDAAQVDTRFLLYFFLSPDWRRTVQQRINVGSTVDRIPLVEFPGFPLRLPPMATQRKIAAILSAYDELIENNARRIKILEEMAQAIYREWFVAFRYPGHEDVPLVESEMGLLPVGWDMRTLGQSCELVMGQSPKSEFYNTEGTGLPFHQGVTNFGDHFPTHETYSTAGDRRAQPMDILFSVRAPVGRINLSNDEIILGRGVCAIRPDADTRWFVYCQLNHLFQELDVIGNGAIFNSVTRADMERIRMMWPDVETTRVFESLAEPLMRLLKICTLANGRLRAARDLLLPRLISGEIDVADLDIDTSGLAA